MKKEINYKMPKFFMQKKNQIVFKDNAYLLNVDNLVQKYNIIMEKKKGLKHYFQTNNGILINIKSDCVFLCCNRPRLDVYNVE